MEEPIDSAKTRGPDDPAGAASPGAPAAQAQGMTVHRKGLHGQPGAAQPLACPQGLCILGLGHQQADLTDHRTQSGS